MDGHASGHPSSAEAEGAPVAGAARPDIRGISGLPAGAGRRVAGGPAVRRVRPGWDVDNGGEKNEFEH